MTAGATAIPEVQALLRTLAAGRDVAEMGAAYGETAAVLAETGGSVGWETILELIEPGGIIVKDDLTPGRAVEGDDIREFLLREPRLAAAEILVRPDMAVIVAVRLPPS